MPERVLYTVRGITERKSYSGVAVYTFHIHCAATRTNTAVPYLVFRDLEAGTNLFISPKNSPQKYEHALTWTQFSLAEGLYTLSQLKVTKMCSLARQVRPSACNDYRHTGRIFMKFYTGEFYQNVSTHSSFG